MKRMDPEKVTHILRRIWSVMAVVCAIGALVEVLLDNPEKVVLFAGSGLFHFLLYLKWPDIDDA
jgi:hypothetical protein